MHICKGDTGHAEAIRITFDSSIISFGTLLELFFATHDPTTLIVKEMMWERNTLL
jgi:peptide-methionine (S)-S-oxide reductase